MKFGKLTKYIILFTLISIEANLRPGKRAVQFCGITTCTNEHEGQLTIASQAVDHRRGKHQCLDSRFPGEVHDEAEVR